MKTELLEYVSPADFRRLLAKLVGTEGSQRAAAEVIGIKRERVSQMLTRPDERPTRKALEHFGLEARHVLVPKPKGKKTM